jgi:hypothetical protein
MKDLLAQILASLPKSPWVELIGVIALWLLWVADRLLW